MEFYATPPIDGAFAQYCVIRTEFAHKVPDSMSDESAALLEPLSVAVTTMRKAGVAPGSSILIAGAGPVGIICAQAARAFGAAEIIVTDLVQERRERALHYGATRVLDPRETDVATAGLDVNAFVDASGSPHAVMSGIKAVRPAGTAVLVGLGSSEMTLPVEHIQNLEITVTGIFRYTDTWPAGIHLVASGLVELDSLTTGRLGARRRGAGERPRPEQSQIHRLPQRLRRRRLRAAVQPRDRLGGRACLAYGSRTRAADALPQPRSYSAGHALLPRTNQTDPLIPRERLGKRPDSGHISRLRRRLSVVRGQRPIGERFRRAMCARYPTAAGRASTRSRPRRVLWTSPTSPAPAGAW